MDPEESNKDPKKVAAAACWPRAGAISAKKRKEIALKAINARWDMSKQNTMADYIGRTDWATLFAPALCFLTAPACFRRE